MPWPKGKSPSKEVRNAVSEGQKARYAAIRERLNLEPGESLARATERPVSEVFRGPVFDDDEADEDDEE